MGAIHHDPVTPTAAPNPTYPGFGSEGATDELLAAKVEAERIAELRARWLSNVSHELRTPMNAILGLTKILLETDLDDEQRDYLDLIWQSAESLLTLVNDLLDHSRISEGKLSIEPISFGLRSTLDHIVRSMGATTGERDVKLEALVAVDVPERIVGDPGRLRQVLVNLIGNALKFTPQGEVQVRVDLASATEQAVMLHFQIRDTGIGIHPEELGTIFEPFETGHGAGEPASGTGLGLAISTELVGLMGGKIWVESEPDVGSTFHFTIQAGLEERAIPQPRPPVQGEPQVLVLSDQSRSGAAIAAGVGSERARTMIVSSPERIPEVLGQGAVEGTDVVVVDVRRDAIAVATEITARAPHLASRVLLVMPYGQRGDAARCRRLGLGGYLTGQIDGSLMRDAVDAVASDTGELITRHLLRELGRQK